MSRSRRERTLWPTRPHLGRRHGASCPCGRVHNVQILYVQRKSRLNKVLGWRVWATCDRETAERSAWPYGVVEYNPPGWDFIAYEYVLTVTGVLHRLFGIIRYEED